eukprot:168684_1
MASPCHSLLDCIECVQYGDDGTNRCMWNRDNEYCFNWYDGTEKSQIKHESKCPITPSTNTEHIPTTPAPHTNTPYNSQSPSHAPTYDTITNVEPRQTHNLSEAHLTLIIVPAILFLFILIGSLYCCIKGKHKIKARKVAKPADADDQRELQPIKNDNEGVMEQGHSSDDAHSHLQDTNRNLISIDHDQAGSTELENDQCIICMDKNRKYAFVPCGHMVICEDCKELIHDKCPLCQTQYDFIIKIYK